MLKGQKGITLVALVVTIIVLIILAGVSISLILGEHGIIRRTQEARNRTLNAQRYESEVFLNVDKAINEELNTETGE